MTSSDDDAGEAGGQPVEPEVTTGLLVCRDTATGGPDSRAVERLCAILEAHGLRCGHLVGTVIAVTGPSEQLQALADHVAAARIGTSPAGADEALLRTLRGCIESFAWDEGAETF